MDYQVSFLSDKSVPEAAVAVEAALAERKFSVLFTLDVNAKMEEKGLSLAPQVRILEVCSAPRAKQALEANLEVAYFLPCKIVVRSEGSGSRIGVARPTMLMTVLGEPKLQSLAEEVESILLEAVDAAK